jgi:hypothetical protein
MDDEFSITLPSNVFSKEDPNNTPSKYVTRLHRTIQLSGNWEVAATRLQLQNRWFNFTKPQMLGVYVRNIRTLGDAYDVGNGQQEGETTATEPPKEKEFSRLAQKWKDSSWATDFVKNMTYRCVTFPAGVYTTLEQLGDKLCSRITDAFADAFNDFDVEYNYFPPIKTACLSSVYQDGNTHYVMRIVSLASPAELDVMETLGLAPAYRIVGEDGAYHKYFGGAQLPTKEQVATLDEVALNRFCEIKSKVLSHPTVPEVCQLMLYADVAALRNVGNIEAQLLDTVVVHAKVGDHEDALRGVAPNYVPVYRNTFSTIEIVLTDYAGDQLRFPSDCSSPVIVTLRFRRKKSSIENSRVE